jgi:hypothetical protein
MTEYAAYFDDSGHPDDQAAVVVAGFISTEEQWLLFEREWKEILEREGMESFHMTDFEKSKVWPQHKKDDILRKLVITIQLRTRRSFSQTVMINDYREINDAYAFEECVGTPFALAGRTIAKNINSWKRNYMENDSKLVIVFEDGTKHKGDFIDAMERDKLPCPLFAGKGDAVPLQAADWLAWEMLNGVKTGNMRPSLKRVVGGLPKDDPNHGIYEKKDLEEVCRTYPGGDNPSGVPLRSKLSKGVKIAYHSSPKKPRKRTIGK